MIRKIALMSLAVGISIFGLAQHQNKSSDEFSNSNRTSQRMAKGYVSKPETAIDIARAVIKDAGWYHRELEPLRAKKYDGFWLVYSPSPKDNAVGGRVEVEIEVNSGSILRLFGSS
ncbi:MAG: PepSY domain-containing protein [Armatimonadota bacterium]